MTEKKKSKSALDLDNEITRKGHSYTSPRMERSQARSEKANKEEAKITKKNSKSLVRGVKGFIMGSNYMDAKDAEERNQRQGKRNIKAKAEEAGIRGTLKYLKSKGGLRG